LFLYISIIPEPDRGINSSVCKEQTVRKQSAPFCVYNEAAEDTEKRNKKMDKKQISETTASGRGKAIVSTIEWE